MKQHHNSILKYLKNKFKDFIFQNSKVRNHHCRFNNIDIQLFFLSQELYSDKTSELNDFRTYLLDGSNPMTPLKPWQMQDISLQCAYRALSEKTPANAFDTLIELSQNFPSRAR